MRVFLLDKNYQNDSLYFLKSKEKQYLNKVLRLSIGIEFTAKDINENYYKATLISPDILSLEKTEKPEETLLDELSGYKGSFANIEMYISILKGKKNELVVKALTEIGVKKIVLIQSQYVQEKNFSTHQKERLETILKEAVQQSGSKAPILEGPISFEQAINGFEGKILLLHQAKIGETLSLRQASEKLSIKDTIGCFIGPEGGFSEEECLFAQQNRAQPVLLNTNILRAETASIYTAAALQTLLQG